MMTETLSRSSAMPGATRRKYPPVAKCPAAQRQKGLESHKKCKWVPQFVSKTNRLMCCWWAGRVFSELPSVQSQQAEHFANLVTHREFVFHLTVHSNRRKRLSLQLAALTTNCSFGLSTHGQKCSTFLSLFFYSWSRFVFQQLLSLQERIFIFSLILNVSLKIHPGLPRADTLKVIMFTPMIA